MALSEKEIEERVKILASLPKWLLPSLWLLCSAALWLLIPPFWLESSWEGFLFAGFGGLVAMSLLIWVFWPKDPKATKEKESKEKILLLGPQSLDRIVKLEKRLADKEKWKISCRWLLGSALEERVGREWEPERVEELNDQGYFFGVLKDGPPFRIGLMFLDETRNKQIVVWHKVVIVEGPDRVRWQLGELTEEELLGNFNRAPLNV